MIKNYKYSFMRSMSNNPCLNDKTLILLDDLDIKTNVEAIERELEMNVENFMNDYYDYYAYMTPDDYLTYVGKESLGTAAQMFLYLNLCPKFMFEWTQLYDDLFQNYPPNIILQTLNRILKLDLTSETNILLKITEKIFSKITDKWSLTYKIIIHDLTKDNSTASDAENIYTNQWNESKITNQYLIVIEMYCSFLF